MIYLLCGYMWLFIHRPFEVWPWLGDLRIERAYMLVTIAYWAFFAEKRWTSNRLTPAYLLLGLAITLSNYLSPCALTFDLTVQNWLKIAVFYVLILSTVTKEQDLRRLVAGFLICMGLYIGHSFREFLCGRHVYRMGIARMVGVDSSLGDPNSFAASVVYALPMAMPVWSLCSRAWHKFTVAGYVAVSVASVLLTGSRSALIGLLTLGLLLSFVSPNRVKLTFAIIVTLAVGWCSMREELRNRYLTLADASAGPRNAQVSAESRKAMFFEGLTLWKRYPLTGAGPGCGSKFESNGLQLHNLYGQVLGELGTVGAIALLMIVYGMLANTADLCRLAREYGGDAIFLKQLSTAVFFSLVLLLLLGWAGHNMYRFTWLWYGAFQAIAVSCLDRTCEVLRETSHRDGFILNQSVENKVMNITPALSPHHYPHLCRYWRTARMAI